MFGCDPKKGAAGVTALCRIESVRLGSVRFSSPRFDATRFGSFRSVPFDLRIPRVTLYTADGWVVEGAPASSLLSNPTPKRQNALLITPFPLFPPSPSNTLFFVYLFFASLSVLSVCVCSGLLTAVYFRLPTLAGGCR